MKRYACASLFLHVFFFFFVHGDDMNTMSNLSKTLLVTSSSNGMKWNKTSKNPCLWSGVMCSSPTSGNVINLSLSGLGLTTSATNTSSAFDFFKVLCQLESLESLDLSSNSFTFIPPPSFFSNCSWVSHLKSLNFSSNKLNVSVGEFSSFRNLEALDLSNNMLEGEVGSQLDGLGNLKSLNLSGNNLRGNIPLYPSLEELRLSNNMFHGEIPKEISQLKNLTILTIGMNKLSGSIPRQIGELSNLRKLVLSYNDLTGQIPNEISKLHNLTVLDLSMNYLSGSIPNGIGELSNLKYLSLSSNNLTRQIPNEISKLHNLTVLDLSMNYLSGSIPNGIGQLSNLKYLSLSSNNLTGQILSNLLSIKSLNVFAANQNNFTGAIPQEITANLSFLDLSFNMLSGPIPSLLLSLPNLQTVDLSSNLLEGGIPENFSASLVRLRLGKNKFNGSVPSFQKPSNLTYLELNNNDLHGEIPSELEICQSLALLDLSSNLLHGGLPKELCNLTNLMVLKLQENNLSGEIPSEFSKLANLIALNLSQNSFGGPVPSSIIGLSKLQSLNLAANRLDGSIPSDISNLSVLIELQLGNNKLSGTIPRMPASLTSALNLSSNHLSGAIPSHLDALLLLEILDLSNNNFTGEVPSSLTQMLSLTLLDISNNQLSGILPTFSRHVTVTCTGNSGLGVATPPAGPSPGKKNSKAWVLIVGIVSAVIGVGLVAAVIFLVVSKRFYRVEDEGLQLEERPPQIVNGAYITSDSIHRSNIDFAKAIEVVANPRNVMLKTRFSTYYKAVMPSGMSYSVKKLNWSEKIFQMGSTVKFEHELQVLGRISNSNVMVPLAYFLTQDSAYLFYEHVHKGTIFDFLHNNSENALDWQSRYSIALGVAQGLTFLHGCTQPVLLLDLSTKTIHLKSMKEPQIGDIELCKVIDPSKSTGSLSTVAGSVGYIPPEYAYTMRVTAAGNVYSFGVILLELLTGKPPVSQGIELAKWALSFSTRLDHGEQILDSRVCNASPAVQSQMLSVLKVAVSCVSLSPESRPKMRNVLRSLFNAR